MRHILVKFSDGAHDEMGTVQGQAVLVTLGTIGQSGRLDSLQRGIVQGFSVGGRLVAEARMYQNNTPYQGCT